MDRYLRTIRLLVNNLSDKPLYKQKTLTTNTPSGVVYNLYEPARAAVATYILIYGLDLAGEKDTRLIHFASACASVGLRSVTPDLPGLKSYCFSGKDLQAIADLAFYLHQCYNSPIGVIGFSAGGSYALSMAADQALDWIDPFLLFSPYYSLDGIPPILKPKEKELLVTERDWDFFIWSQLIFAYRHLDRSDFSQAERAELMAMLAEYCDTGPERKHTVYEKLFKDRPDYGLTNAIFTGQNLSTFSLCGKLGRVKGRVFILHDPDDDIIPPEHSEHILAELQQREQPAVQDLLVTRLISHVNPQYRFHPAEGIKAIRLISNLFPR